MWQVTIKAKDSQDRQKRMAPFKMHSTFLCLEPNINFTTPIGPLNVLWICARARVGQIKINIRVYVSASELHTTDAMRKSYPNHKLNLNFTQVKHFAKTLSVVVSFAVVSASVWVRYAIDISAVGEDTTFPHFWRWSLSLEPVDTWTSGRSFDTLGWQHNAPDDRVDFICISSAITDLKGSCVVYETLNCFN